MKRIWVCAVVVAAFLLTWGAPSAYAETSSAKRQDIEKLMDVTGVSNLSEQVANQMMQIMINSMQQNTKEKLSNAQITIIQEEVMNEFRGVLPAMMTDVIGLYDSYFSHADIKALLDFYSTETGRKAISVMPALAQQSLMISQKHIQSRDIDGMEQRIVSRLKALKN